MSFGNAGPRERGWDSQSWSLIIGRWWGIRVRLHLFLLVFIAYRLFQGMQQDVSFSYELSFVGILFGLVLLHEFGHCFGCRAVGGHADDVLLWPLGGLASCAPPHRPYDSLITTVSGPFANLIVCVLLLPILILNNAMPAQMWNPFTDAFLWDATSFVSYVAMTWKLSYWLLLFNILLPIFPFDGGRVLQEILWFRMGHYQATVIATTVGMVGAVILAGAGLYCAGSVSSDYLLLTGLGFFGFLECLRTRRQIEMMGEFPENEFGYDFSQGYTSLERSMKGIQHKENSLSLRSRFKAWQMKRRSREDARLEAELDRILAKIHTDGMDSLSRAERRVLTHASKKRRR